MWLGCRGRGHSFAEPDDLAAYVSMYVCAYVYIYTHVYIYMFYVMLFVSAAYYIVYIYIYVYEAASRTSSLADNRLECWRSYSLHWQSSPPVVARASKTVNRAALQNATSITIHSTGVRI